MPVPGVQQTYPEMDIHGIVTALVKQRTRLSVTRLVRIQPGPSWFIEPRSHDDSLIYLILKGSCVGALNGEPCRWQAGSLWWVAPQVHHHFNPGPDGELDMYVFRWHLGIKQWPFEYLQINDGLSCQPLFDQLLDVWHHPAQEYADLQFRCALAQFLIGISDIAARNIAHGRGLSLLQRQYCYEYLAHHVAHDVKPEDLARVCKLALSHFRRRFKQSFLCSPRTWIARERIRHAATLMRDAGLTVEAAAQACGYQSMPSFSRCFKQVMGKSPSAYR